MKNNKSKKAVVKKADEAIVPISIEEVKDKIIVLRGEPIILDRDVAALYGVQTKDVNRAVSNNPRKFPSGYTFVLDNQEVAELRLKILTTTQEDADNKGVKPLVKHTIKRKKK